MFEYKDIKKKYKKYKKIFDISIFEYLIDINMMIDLNI